MIEIPAWVEPYAVELPCRIAGEVFPEGYAVDCAERAFIAPYYSVVNPGDTYRDSVRLRVRVVAEIVSKSMWLADLPGCPINGTQRILLTPTEAGREAR